jgi:hypothetical protein
MLELQILLEWIGMGMIGLIALSVALMAIDLFNNRDKH